MHWRLNQVASTATASSRKWLPLRWRGVVVDGSRVSAALIAMGRSRAAPLLFPVGAACIRVLVFPRLACPAGLVRRPTVHCGLLGHVRGFCVGVRQPPPLPPLSPRPLFGSGYQVRYANAARPQPQPASQQRRFGILR